MTDKRQEARLRHATHYVRVAQEHRTDLTQIALNLPNILKAGDFCVQLAKWNLLADLTDAINEYLLRGQWLDYIKLNSALVTNDLTELPDARIKRVHQLIELEENQGNYPQALEWNKFLIELQLSAGIQDTREVITALKRMAKLCQRHGKDHDAVDYLKDGLVFARKVEDKKNEVDLLFELASFYNRQEDSESSLQYCELGIRLARSIGYSLAELDIMALMAALHVGDKRDRALSLYEETLLIAQTLGDVERHATLQLEREKLLQLITLEQTKNRKVFISYNHKDREFVERLANDLKKHGLAVWWDQWEIRVGESIIQKINDGIDSSAYLIAVLSSHSVQSHFVQREINSALMRQLSAERNIVILPLVLADCDIPTLLREIKCANFRDDYEVGLKSLLERLQDTVSQR